MNAPRVSIGLPVFNGANYLQRSVLSVLAQDYDSFELLISDNASTDETEAICRELMRSDKRIRYHRNDTNVGASRNYNQVFRMARGEYFKWAAHDDECHPAMVRRCVEVLDQAPPRVTMVYPLAELIDESGQRLSAPLDRIESRDSRPHRRLAHLLRTLNMCDPVFGVYRVEALKKTQLIGPFFAADYVLLAELAMMGEIWELDEILFRLRAHARRSMQAHASRRARTAWYDPAAAMKAFVLPDWEQMVWQLLKSARHAPLPSLERWRCAMTVLGVHYFRRTRNAGGRMKLKLKARCGLAGKPEKPVGSSV